MYITRKINYKENIISSSFSDFVICGLSLHVTDSVNITEICLKHLKNRTIYNRFRIRLEHENKYTM